MSDSGERRATAIAALAGSVLLFVGTYLHPMEADPNDAPAAFAEYAADRLWVASHLTQLAGVVLMLGALVLVSWMMRRGPAAGWALLGAIGAVGSLAVTAAVQAVDGVALKVMVDLWAASAEAQKAAVYQAAFAVRQIEVGLAAMASLLLGATFTLYGIAFVVDRSLPRWLGWLAIVCGVPTVVAGVVMAHTGFSGPAMAISMPANSLILLWMIALGVMIRRYPGTGGEDVSHSGHG